MRSPNSLPVVKTAARLALERALGQDSKGPSSSALVLEGPGVPGRTAFSV